MLTDVRFALGLLAFSALVLLVEYVWCEMEGRQTSSMLVLYSAMKFTMMAGVFLFCRHFGWNLLVCGIVCVIGGLVLWEGAYLSCAIVNRVLGAPLRFRRRRWYESRPAGWWLENKNFRDMSPQDRAAAVWQVPLRRIRKQSPSLRRDQSCSWIDHHISRARAGLLEEAETRTADTILASEIVLERARQINTWNGLGHLAKCVALLSFLGVLFLFRAHANWANGSIALSIFGVFSALSISEWVKRRGALDTSELPFSSLEPHLFLLRSFQDDKWRWTAAPFGLAEFFLGFSLEDEILRREAISGAVVTIARPGGVPPAGRFVRITLPGPDWQSSVISLIARSKAVLLFPQFTGSLNWEAEYMLRKANRCKLLVLVPAKGYLDVATKWSKFICQMRRSGVPLEPREGWPDPALRQQEKLLPDNTRMVQAIRKYHAEHGGDAATYNFLRHCLLIRAVGCAYNSEGAPELFVSEASGSFGGKWWRPNPYTYGTVLRMMMDYLKDPVEAVDRQDPST